jgi:hypothetical protein
MAPALGETIMFQVASAVENLADFAVRPILEEVAS